MHYDEHAKLGFEIFVIIAFIVFFIIMLVSIKPTKKIFGNQPPVTFTLYDKDHKIIKKETKEILPPPRKMKQSWVVFFALIPSIILCLTSFIMIFVLFCWSGSDAWFIPHEVFKNYEKK